MILNSQSVSGASFVTMSQNFSPSQCGSMGFAIDVCSHSSKTRSTCAFLSASNRGDVGDEAVGEVEKILSRTSRRMFASFDLLAHGLPATGTSLVHIAEDVSTYDQHLLAQSVPIEDTDGVGDLLGARARTGLRTHLDREMSHNDSK